MNPGNRTLESVPNHCTILATSLKIYSFFLHSQITFVIIFLVTENSLLCKTGVLHISQGYTRETESVGYVLRDTLQAIDLTYGGSWLGKSKGQV